MDRERSGEDVEAARASLNGAPDDEGRPIGQGVPRQRRRGTEDFARGSVDGVPGIVMLFRRGMAVQRERADVSDERHRQERQDGDRHQVS
jgi:hypothetical protein